VPTRLVSPSSGRRHCDPTGTDPASKVLPSWENALRLMLCAGIRVDEGAGHR